MASLEVPFCFSVFLSFVTVFPSPVNVGSSGNVERIKWRVETGSIPAFGH